MRTSILLQKRWFKWVVGFAIWTFIGLSFASQFYISSAKAGLEISWKQAVTHALGDWYVFALLSIPVMALSRRLRFEAGSWTKSFLAHSLGSVLFSLAFMVLRALVGQWQNRDASFDEAFKPLLVKTWYFNLMIYWVILTVSQAFEYYRRYRDHELQTAELEKRLVQAKLQALQMQLNPHFLFNTLHSISSLMHKDVEAADKMIVRLSDLLRAALENSDAQEVPLSSELKMLNLYLSIEQTRFGNRLTTTMDIAPDTLDAQVPNLILQPLVENAIRHGIEPRSKPGRIALRARRQADVLAMEVCDNGVGLRNNKEIEEGIGLSNTRARLRELYGPAHRLELVEASGGGLRVELSIPFRQNSLHEDTNPDRR